MGLHQLPRAAADLVLLGDLTGRYATGSYSKLSSDRRTLALREDRQGAADHGHRVTAAIACHVARLGGTVHQLLRLLMHPDHEGGRHTQTIALRSGQARAHGYVHRVWANACATVHGTMAVESRQHAHEDLAVLRDRIETVPWIGSQRRTALRVLRAHLNFAEKAGGRQHAASERQTAEEAGISRQTLRNAYETVLKPSGWLRRLRIGHGTEGSTWYLGDGAEHPSSPSSRTRTTQCPPAPDLGEWSNHETPLTADIDSTVISRLMTNDAFAHHGLSGSALMVIGALHAHPGQTAAELVGTASVSRATAYRTLHRLAVNGLVQRSGEIWVLAPNALDGIGHAPEEAVTDSEAEVLPSRGWNDVSHRYGTTGIAAQRKALHAAERAAYRAALEQIAEHRNKALVVVHDGRSIPVPAPRADEIPAEWQADGGAVLDPATGRVAPEWRVATDGRLILITPADQRSYDELVAAHAEAVHEWESAA
ncbi:MarR family winged helix-turn-helix transcriptional regulator [Streptomyces hygroscopicus]|uniref:MarR family winged helix-turn-helix transcriptional regulator n=1 Tax=Streptomyces hygroscopicus TaxID=1912 RepID=UPI001FCCBBA1|nr:MarR family winged helix-turn-helix transcriptional regulator [Streptomyces hygroscopicus]